MLVHGGAQVLETLADRDPRLEPWRLRLARRLLPIRASLDAVLDRGEALLGLVFRARRDDRDAAELAHRALVTCRGKATRVSHAHAKGCYGPVSCAAAAQARSTSRPKARRASQASSTSCGASNGPAVTSAVSEAAAQGDRSENAEYIYGKKQLAEIDRRVRLLAQAAERESASSIRRRATRARCTSARGSSSPTRRPAREYRLVGPDEFDFAPEYISVDSPLGRAVLGQSA